MMLGLRVKWQCAAQQFHFHNIQSVTIKINHSCKIFSYANKDDLLNFETYKYVGEHNYTVGEKRLRTYHSCHLPDYYVSLFDDIIYT